MHKKKALIEKYEVGEYIVPSHHIAFSDSNPDGKEVLVCIHSLITNSHDFDFLAKDISKDFRVIAIDMVGRGDSDWFEDEGLYNYEVYISDFLSLMNYLDIKKFHFLGVSMGGIIGMVLASNPQMVQSLILNDIGPHLPGRSLAKIRKYVGKTFPMPTYYIAKQTMQMIFKYFGIKQDDHWDHVTKHNTRKGKLGFFYMNYDPKIAHNFVVDLDNPEDIEFWEIWDQVGNIPILLIRGEKSNILIQETVDKMNEKHNMDLYNIADVGHAPALFEHNEIKYIESWLKNIKQKS